MVGRPDYDAELIGMLESTVGCPAITTAGAEVAALTQAATKKLALLTPYPEQMTLMEKEHLEMTVPGLKVVSHRSLGMSSGLVIGDIEPMVAYRESRNIDTDHADCPVSQRDQLKDSKRGTIDRIGLGHACFLGYSSVDVGGFRQAWNIW